MEGILSSLAENHGPEWVLIILLVVRLWQVERTLLQMIKQEQEVKVALITSLRSIRMRLGMVDDGDD